MNSIKNCDRFGYGFSNALQSRHLSLDLGKLGELWSPYDHKLTRGITMTMNFDEQFLFNIFYTCVYSNSAMQIF